MIYCSLNTCFHGSPSFVMGVPFRRKGAVQNTHKRHPHSSPVRARFGVSFVSSKSDLCSGVTVVISVLYEISYHISYRVIATLNCINIETSLKF